MKDMSLNQLVNVTHSDLLAACHSFFQSAMLVLLVAMDCAKSDAASNCASFLTKAFDLAPEERVKCQKCILVDNNTTDNDGFLCIPYLSY